MDRNLNSLLRWGIENSTTSTSDPTSKTDRSAETSNLTPEIIAALMGGPSDADLMREAMAAIQSPDVDNDNRAIVWDNFEQMVENIDNANNIAPLKLWDPLVAQMKSNHDESRLYASWCVGTAVQNNVKAQEKVSWFLRKFEMFPPTRDITVANQLLLLLH
jgi:hsp70-interacting protein